MDLGTARHDILAMDPLARGLCSTRPHLTGCRRDGELDLNVEAMELQSEPDLRLNIAHPAHSAVRDRCRTGLRSTDVLVVLLERDLEDRREDPREQDRQRHYQGE